METKKLVLIIIFSTSLLFLWDAWQKELYPPASQVMPGATSDSANQRHDPLPVPGDELTSSSTGTGTASEIEGINLKIKWRKFDQTERVIVTTITDKELVNEKTYDSYGNLIEEIVNLPVTSPEGNGPEKHIHTYDRDGNEIERNVYKNGRLTYAYRYTYDFDHWKNWTKKKKTRYISEYGDSGFTPSSITYREISYYED